MTDDKTKETPSPVPKETSALPVLTPDGGLDKYLREIRAFPLLTAEEEFALARRWREQHDMEAAHRLVTSHLRLVAKVAMGYRGYGLPIGEVISEGNIGLMQAVRRFDPDKGFRLTTYALWWIRASIQEYVLRSWSLVKIGTTAAQKKLFFNLKRAKREIEAAERGDLTPEQAQTIAERLDVSETEVMSMNRRLAGGDASLNAPVRADGDTQEEWQDWLVDETPSQEEEFAAREEAAKRHKELALAMGRLDEREQRILMARRLQETPMTLEDLSQEFGVSRERIRQIELAAFEKVKKSLTTPQLTAPK